MSNERDVGNVSRVARGDERAADIAFDPGAHRPHAPRPFSAFRVGETFHIPSRTVTSAHFAAFQMASGDNHPIHYDVEHCRRHGHPGLLAHGFQVLIQSCAGACALAFVMEDDLVGFLEQSSQFLKPVYEGDTLYPRLTIADVIPQRTTGVLGVASVIHNQRGEVVMRGTQRYLMRLR
ncbi:MAG: MaoC family dehydratase [Pseudomonadota bacterium]